MLQMENRLLSSMSHRDVCALHILEAFEDQAGLTQRELARTIGVSVGLVNGIIKTMGEKGYFQIDPMAGNRSFYRLTEKGFNEKRRLTRLFILLGYRCFRRSRHRLTAMFQELADQGVCRVVFFGAADFAEMAYLALRQTKLEVVAVIDDMKVGEATVFGAVENSERLSDLNFDLIVITDFEAGEQRYQDLLSLGMVRERIFFCC